MPAHLSPENLDLAIELQRKCFTHERIAAQLGVHRTTVSRSLSKYNKRALKLLESRSASVKAQQVAQLEYMAEEAINQWHRSKLDAETVKTTDDNGVTKTDTTIKGQTGDPGYLREARGALADVRKILGLDAPPTKPDAAFDLSQLTAEAEQEATNFVPDERPRPDQGPADEVPG